MKKLDAGQMLEATRLTRAGKLTEAVALLQRVLGGAATRPHEDRHPAKLRTQPILLPHLSDADATMAEGPVQAARAHEIGRSPPFELPNLQLSKGKRAPRDADIFPAAGKFIAGTFASSMGHRSYKLYVPSTYKGEPLPLIVMLHGCTQSPDDFAAGTRMNFAAEERACFVVYPEQSQAANVSKCWNWFKSTDQQRGRGEPALIAGIVRHVMSEFKIDARRIYVAGLSAGGAAAAIAGEAYPDLFAAVGVHSGLACGAARDLPSAFAAMRGDMSDTPAGIAKHRVPTIVFHGDQDTTVHPRNGDKVIARANSGAGLQVSPDARRHEGKRKYTRSVKLDRDGRATLELWVVHGAGHAWSGGSAAGSFTDPKGPDASKEMLRFFLDHARVDA